MTASRFEIVTVTGRGGETKGFLIKPKNGAKLTDTEKAFLWNITGVAKLTRRGADTIVVLTETTVAKRNAVVTVEQAIRNLLR